MARLTGISKNLNAFLDMIRLSEGTKTSPITKDDGYDVIVTGLGERYGEVFSDYSDHPFVGGRPGKIFDRNGTRSTAAGGYQILYRYWKVYKQQLGLSDFRPGNQDKVAIQLVKECKALDDIESGRIESAIRKCSSRWASFPGAGYGQREHKIDKLVDAYKKFGGVVAA